MYRLSFSDVYSSSYNNVGKRDHKPFDTKNFCNSLVREKIIIISNKGVCGKKFFMKGSSLQL